jgi:riboflavin biosynthesis pyrimidine reductase
MKNAQSSLEVTNFLKKNGFEVSKQNTTSVMNYHTFSTGIKTSIYARKALIHNERVCQVYEIEFFYKAEEKEAKLVEARELLKAAGYHLLKQRSSNSLLVEGLFVRKHSSK